MLRTSVSASIVSGFLMLGHNNKLFNYIFTLKTIGIDIVYVMQGHCMPIILYFCIGAPIVCGTFL